jgi:hypothetical protein
MLFIFVHKAKGEVKLYHRPSHERPDGGLRYRSILSVTREHSKVNKTVPGKVATTRTEDGHK